MALGHGVTCRCKKSCNASLSWGMLIFRLENLIQFTLMLHSHTAPDTYKYSMSSKSLMNNFSVPVLNPGKLGNREANCKACGTKVSCSVKANSNFRLNLLQCKYNEIYNIKMFSFHIFISNSLYNSIWYRNVIFTKTISLQIGIGELK